MKTKVKLWRGFLLSEFAFFIAIMLEYFYPNIFLWNFLIFSPDYAYFSFAHLSL